MKAQLAKYLRSIRTPGTVDVMIHVSSAFDGGNIEVVSANKADDIQLRIRKDNASEFFQWFYFRVSGAREKLCRIRIINAGEASYADGFRDYKACMSEDLRDWRRVDTSYDGQELTINYKPSSDSFYIAFFAPYSLDQQRRFVARCQRNPLASLEVIGHTVEGRDLDLLVIGSSGASKKVCWIIARQHPGETMGCFWMEGFLGRLLDSADTDVLKVRESAVFYIVPNMNPDGSARGNLRTNAAGANLNREWARPSKSRSPEVFAVRNRMVETGVDLCLDVHGDETIPYNFISGADHVPSADTRMKQLLIDFNNALLHFSPDFQTDHGYPTSFQANLSICASNVAESFKCLSMTLEMPFADHNNRKDNIHGWSPERCRNLGGDCLKAISSIIPSLR